MSVSAALPRIPPIDPDFHRCDISHGIDIAPEQCTALVNQYFPRGNDLINWYLRAPKGGDAPRPANSVQLPISHSSEYCTISIDWAGPETHSLGFVQAFPAQMRGYAGYLIAACPQRRNGLGGFITKGMDVVARSLANVPEVLPEETTLGTIEALGKLYLHQIGCVSLPIGAKEVLMQQRSKRSGELSHHHGLS